MSASDIAAIRNNLVTLKAWIEHWDEDRKCGLACTKESLDSAMFRVANSLAAIERLEVEARPVSPGAIVANHNPYDEATMLRQVPTLKRKGEAA